MKQTRNVIALILFAFVILAFFPFASAEQSKDDPIFSQKIVLKEPSHDQLIADSGARIEAAPLEPADPLIFSAQPAPAALDENPDMAEEKKDNSEATPPPAPLGMSYDSNGTADKAVKRGISLFKDTIRERFHVWLERSARYIEIMKEVLKERKLPEELVFLPLIESGFNINAYSRAKAVGPWQFIAATAQRYGLVIDWWRDERKDPVKSTDAAAKYLKDLYEMFGSWNLALAAYNAGEGRIARALKKSNTTDYWSLITTKQLKDETKEYVPRYIAATMIANAPEEYGFNDLSFHPPFKYEEVTLTSPVDIEVIAECSGSTVKEIQELNPELKRWSTPPNVAEYTIRVPAGTKDTFLTNLSAIPDEERFSVDNYTVRKGDTIKKVAKRTGTPVPVILAMNSLKGIERLSAGEELKLPPKDKYAPDLDDKVSAKKVSYTKKIAGKKTSSKGKKLATKKGKTSKKLTKKSRPKNKTRNKA